MNKKILILFVIVVLAVVGYIFFYKKETVVYRMGTGKVLEVKENSIVAQGYFETKETGKNIVTVEFITNSKTVFKRTAMIIDVKKYSGKGFFTPELRKDEGSFSDIKKGTAIDGVTSNNKLVDKGTAKALEIDYSTVVYE